MYLKSDETEGTPPSEHMDIFAKNRLWVPRGVWEAQCVKTIVFFQSKWRERPFRLDETTSSVTKSAACAQKFLGHRDPVGIDTQRVLKQTVRTPLR